MNLFPKKSVKSKKNPAKLNNGKNRKKMKKNAMKQMPNNILIVLILKIIELILHVR